MKKRTIERKNKEGLLSSVAKNLGLRPKDVKPAPPENKGEFDDLISALRTGDVFGEEKFKRSRKTKGGSSPPRNRSGDDSRERSGYH